MNIREFAKKHTLLLSISVVSAILFGINVAQSPLFLALFHNGSVLAESDVNISAQVDACALTVEVLPEKRIPPVNNWATTLNIQLFDSLNVYKGEFTVDSNNLGRATVDLCALGISLPAGQYSYWVKGLSHLRKNYGTFTSFGTINTNLNLTLEKSPDGLLRAGETSNVYNGYINTLDISTVITKLYSNDERNDLNQDTKVNVLDISNTITNFNLVGDCSPKEDADGIC